MQDIRDLKMPLGHWNDNPQHPGWGYCYCVTLNPYRIHIAKKADFKVLGSFPNWTTATATMQKLYQLEAEAAAAEVA